MPETTSKLGLVLLASGGAGAETYVNENSIKLEAMSNLNVLDRNLTSPPGSPARGDAYIVASSGSGAWSGQTNNIAIYDGNSWRFVTPSEGMKARVADEDVEIEYNGSVWFVRDTTQTLTDGATVNWNMALGAVAVVTLGGNRTLAAPTNVVIGRTYTIIVIQDGTGGRTLTWNSNFKFPDGTAPVLSAAANSIDRFTFVARTATDLQLVAASIDRPESWPTVETWTGRYKRGKKLYVRAYNLGTLPNTTSATIAHGITGIDFSAEFAPTFEGVANFVILALPIPTIVQTLWIIDLAADGTNITVGTNFDGTFATAWVRMFYCKT